MSSLKFVNIVLLQGVYLFFLLTTESCDSPLSGKSDNRIKYIMSFGNAFFGDHADLSKLINYEKDLTDLLGQDNLNSSNLYVEIDKSDYRLSLKNDTGIIKQYPVVFGLNPIDDKLMEGDCCTPEGSFKVLASYKHDRWSRFIWFNYPTRSH